jgi:hypothetical protein
MAELELPAIEQAVVVRPGDLLVLRLGTDVTVEQFVRLREQVSPMLKERFPDVEVFFFGGGVEQVAAFRRDELAEADPG